MLAAEPVLDFALPRRPGRAGGENPAAAGAEGAALAALAGCREEATFLSRLSARRSQEPRGVGMAWVFQQAAGQSGFHSFASVEDDDAVAEGSDHAEVMGDPEKAEGALDLDFADEIQKLGLHAGIKCGCGFIQDQQLRIAAQGHGQAEPLPLTAGEFVGEPGEEGGIRRKAQALKQRAKPHHRRGLPFLAMDAGKERHLIRRGHEGVEGLERVLGYPGEPCPSDSVPIRTGPIHGDPKGLDPALFLMGARR